jgi:predicted acetyltransferase
MLRLALGIARDSLQLARVLVTCDDDNLGSIRAIERNGGILQDVVAGADTGPPKRRYWIDTTRS